jgi:hypothetical protein
MAPQCPLSDEGAFALWPRVAGAPCGIITSAHRHGGVEGGGHVVRKAVHSSFLARCYLCVRRSGRKYFPGLSRSQMLKGYGLQDGDDPIEPLDRVYEKAHHPIEPKAPPGNASWSAPLSLGIVNASGSTYLQSPTPPPSARNAVPDWERSCALALAPSGGSHFQCRNGADAPRRVRRHR